MSSLPSSLSVSFTEESSCSLPSKDNFYYYLHNIMHTIHFYTRFNTKFFKWLLNTQPWITNVPRSDCSFPDDFACLDTSSNTFALDFCNIRGFRSNFQSVEHHLSSTKTHLFFLNETQLSMTTDSSPCSVPSCFIFIFNSKLAVAPLCVMTLLALVPTILSVILLFVPSA